MRGLKFLAPLLILWALLGGTARGEAPARDLSSQCLLNGRADSRSLNQMRDGNYRTFWTSVSRAGAHTLTVTAPEAVGGVLVRWRTPAPLAVEAQVDGAWTRIAQSETDYAALYLPLPGVTEFRLVNRDDPHEKLEICELTVLSQGAVPAWVPRFRPPKEQVDLLLLSAHPDDEVLWFGGLLPYYAGEREKECLVVCFAYNAYHRRLELLDSLWTCGVAAYPVFAGYQDAFTSSLQEMYQHWNKRYLYRNVCALYRQYKPLVVVSHDKNGEYGHGAHQAVSDAARKAVALAADPAEFPESAAAWGTWQTPKVYIHLWAENALTMDWHQPLASFGGQTAQEMARQAYACHASQQRKRWAVADGGPYDNARFGLYATAVGYDQAKDDLFEHLE